jgi:CHAT domain-containing protein
MSSSNEVAGEEFLRVAALLAGRCMTDPPADYSEARRLAAEFVNEIPSMIGRGDVVVDAVRSLDAQSRWLRERASLPAAIAVSVYNLAAARALGDSDAIRAAALTMVGLQLLYLIQLDPGQVDVRRAIVDEALELAGVWNLEELNPALLAELYLQAGNVYAVDSRPFQGTLDLAVNWFVKGYRLKRRAGTDHEQLAPLEELLRKAAVNLLRDGTAADVLPITVDVAWVHRAIHAAIGAFEALGQTVPLRQAQQELLQFYVQRRFLESARPIIGQLVRDTTKLTPRQRIRLALLRADWLSQQELAAEALDALAPLADEQGVTAEDLAYAENIRANCYRLVGRLEEAYQVFLRLDERGKVKVDEDPQNLAGWHMRIVAQTHLGYIALQRGQVQEGNHWFQDAEHLIRERLVPAHIRLRHADMWAMGLYDAEQWSSALERYEAARTLHQEVARGVSDPSVREAFLGTWNMIYSRIIELRLRLDDPAGALTAAEDSKARVLRELAALYGRPAAEPMGTQQLERRQLLHDHALLAGERSRVLEQLATETDVASALQLEAQARALEGQLAQCRLRLEAQMALTPAAAPDDRTPTEDPVQVLPGNDGKWLLVSYHLGADGCAVMVATPGNPPAVVGEWRPTTSNSRFLELAQEPWEDARRRYFGGELDAQAFRDALNRYRERLYELLWVPVAASLDHLDRQRVLVLPHRGLHLVPFAALQAEGSAVLDVCDAVCVAPGARFLQALPTRQIHSVGRMVAFGVPDQQAPLMGVEAALVGGRLQALSPEGVDVRLDEVAEPEALYRAAPNARLIHLACHGQWTPRNPSRSGLRLAPLPVGAPDLFGQASGLVSLPALLNQLWLPVCGVAVLSACESGVVKRSAADEPLSLPLAFLLAGCQVVLATLWPVRDDSTFLLVGELYRLLVEGTSPADGLVAAQRWLREISPETASTRLEAGLRLLPGLHGEKRTAQAAEALLLRRIEELGRMTPDEHPYEDPDHWAAFICYGRPAYGLA